MNTSGSALVPYGYTRSSSCRRGTGADVTIQDEGSDDDSDEDVAVATLAASQITHNSSSRQPKLSAQQLHRPGGVISADVTKDTVKSGTVTTRLGVQDRRRHELGIVIVEGTASKGRKRLRSGKYQSLSIVH